MSSYHAITPHRLTHKYNKWRLVCFHTSKLFVSEPTLMPTSTAARPLKRQHSRQKLPCNPIHTHYVAQAAHQEHEEQSIVGFMTKYFDED
jgi:hypothetical protein